MASKRIRQLVLAVPSLEPAVAEISAVFGTDVAYRDPEVAKFGIENAMFVVGDQFLELVAPTSDSSAVARHLGRRGPSPYMFIVQTDDLNADRARVDKMGIRIIWTSEREAVRAMHLHPKDVGVAIFSFDQPTEPAEWPWAGPDWKSFSGKGRASGFAGAVIDATDPSQLAAHWAQMMDLSHDGTGIPLDDADIHFRQGTDDQLSAFSVYVTDKSACLAVAAEKGLMVDGDDVTIAGTVFSLVTAT